MLDQIQTIFTTLGAIVTACTMICAGLDIIAKVTPTTKDDAFVSKTKVVLSTIAAVLDNFSTWQTKR